MSSQSAAAVEPMRTIGNRTIRKYNAEFGKADLPLRAKLYGKKGKEALSILGKGIAKAWSTPAKGRHIPIKEFVAYSGYTFGVSSFYSWVTALATAVNIPYYYGVKAIHGYLIILLSVVINMVIQPFIAKMFENTNTKYGKYKPFVLLSIPAMSLLTILISILPMGKVDNIGNTIYVYLTFIPAGLLNGIMYFMWQTFPSIITPHEQERVDIISPAQIVFGAAPSVLQVIRGPLRVLCTKKFGDELWEVRIVGVLMAIVGFALVLSILRVKERVYVVNKDKQSSMDAKTIIKELFANKPLIILSLALMIGSLRLFPKEFIQLIFQVNLSPDIKSALNFIGVPLTIIGFATTVATVLLPLLTRKMSKRAIMVVFTLLMAAAYGSVALVGFSRVSGKIIEVTNKGNTFKLDILATIILTTVFFLVSVTPELLLIPIMLGEICDYQQSISGRRYEGHIQNFLFVMPLVAMAIGRLMVEPIQRKIGFQPSDYVFNNKITQYTTAQIQTANKWFRVVFIIGAVAALAMGLILLLYPLSKKKHQEAMEKIKANSVDVAVAEKRRVVVEKSRIFLANEYNHLRRVRYTKKGLALNKQLRMVVGTVKRLERQSQYMNGLQNVCNANNSLRKLNKISRACKVNNYVNMTARKSMRNMLLG